MPHEITAGAAVVRPLQSNIYLDSLDHLMAEKGIEMVRYADDFWMPALRLANRLALLVGRPPKNSTMAQAVWF